MFECICLIVFFVIKEVCKVLVDRYVLKDRFFLTVLYPPADAIDFTAHFSLCFSILILLIFRLVLQHHIFYLIH